MYIITHNYQNSKCAVKYFRKWITKIKKGRRSVLPVSFFIHVLDLSDYGKRIYSLTGIIIRKCRFYCLLCQH